MTTALQCPMCGAPLRLYEWVPHVKGCMRLAASDGRDQPAVPTVEQRLAPYGPGPKRDDLIPQLPSEPRSFSEWLKGRKRSDGGQLIPESQPVPEGRVQCPACAGLKALYPECGHCGGVGWV